MPGRQSHGRPPSKKSKSRVSNKNKLIDAFAIASQQNPEKAKIRQHRLGDVEDDNRPAKRVRVEGNDGNEGEIPSEKHQRKNTVKGRFAEPDIDAGSDSEGNEWRMGYVDSEDDSDLDSDEAFGHGDEERFKGYVFSGSSQSNGKNEKDAGSQDIALSEVDNSLERHSGSEDDTFGDEAVDLAAMLDDTGKNNQDDTKLAEERGSAMGQDSSEGGSEVESEDSDEDSSIFSVEDHDEGDLDKVTAIQNLVASLPQADLSKTPSQQRSNGASEFSNPSNFGITSKVKLTLEDLSIPSVRDPFVKRSLKLLASESKNNTKGRDVPGKLAVPLAKRQQDLLDRSAAYEKSKETLHRWTDTIKHNRRAEHLIFPLPDADAASANANARLQPTTSSKPFNALEATIQTILEESGLATTNGKDDENKIMEFEELEANKMSIEEVKAHHAQLRMARDLIFREEARAKRIKKIKSKSYRRVHRKQRENRQALIEAVVNPSEDEQELQDCRRAEERMGAKHRDSKWAKATKEAGRAAWDEDARAGVIEMAKREEELRKRVEGRKPSQNGADESESSVSDSEDESTEDRSAERARMIRILEGMGTSHAFTDSAPRSRLADMKFMLKAEATRKKENDSMVKEIIKELASESSSDDAEDELREVGRRIFGPGNTQINEEDSRKVQKSNEFEEPSDEGDEGDDDDTEIRTTAQNKDTITKVVYKKTDKPSKSRHNNTLKTVTSNPPNTNSGGGAWSRTASRKEIPESRRQKQKLKSEADVEELDISNATVIAKQAKPKYLNAGQSTLQLDDSDEYSEAGDTLRLPYAIRDQELIKRAFAGADVVGEFEAEKRQAIEDEGEKVIDNTLPGWGSWVGDGISKKDKQQNKGRFMTKSEGIKEQDRKDAKLDRVIINEKRVKKNGKYLATNLPHPFETRQQYERSLRLPVGPEWTTKETFQDAIKPRILMRQGIIAPMSKPLF